MDSRFLQSRGSYSACWLLKFCPPDCGSVIVLLSLFDAIIELHLMNKKSENGLHM